MLYILGGASRSGKTMFARRAVAEKQIPYFPLDAIFGALSYGAPQLGVTYDDSLLVRPTKIWPVARHLLNVLLKEEEGYLVEGDSILPSQIHELITEGHPVRCCFLGYTELTKDEKLILVRKFHPNQA